MKNDLSKEEAELRKKKDRQTKLSSGLQQKPKFLDNIILHEISSTFSLLLWISSALSFLAYGLNLKKVIYNLLLLLLLE